MWSLRARLGRVSISAVRTQPASLRTHTLAASTRTCVFPPTASASLHSTSLVLARKSKKSIMSQAGAAAAGAPAAPRSAPSSAGSISSSSSSSARRRPLPLPLPDAEDEEDLAREPLGPDEFAATAGPRGGMMQLDGAGADDGFDEADLAFAEGRGALHDEDDSVDAAFMHDALPPLERVAASSFSAAAAAKPVPPRSYLSEFDDPLADEEFDSFDPAASSSAAAAAPPRWTPAPRRAGHDGGATNAAAAAELFIPAAASAVAAAPVGDSRTYAAAVEALQRHWGFSSFRPGQFELIDAVLNHRRDAYVLMATGAGKSLCFQLLPLISGKPCVVISPLISLMGDQVAALRARGIKACALNSAEMDRNVARDAFEGKYSLIYMAPERLTSSMNQLMALNDKVGISAFAIDESHCLSEWGHDFRAEYRQLGRLRAAMPSVPIMALTATATPSVSADIESQLQLRDPLRVRTTFNRPNLFFKVGLASAIKKDFTRELVGGGKESCIVYVQTRADTEEIAKHLQSIGIEARAYHAALPSNVKEDVHRRFIRDEMGIDHAETRKVINYGLVKNLESLVQMSGRAGRDGQPASCTLLYSAKDYSMLSFWKGKNGGGASGGFASSQGAGAGGDRSMIISRMFDKMKEYINSSRCRRVMLLEYFAEDWRRNAPAPEHAQPGVIDSAGNCKACDNCCAVNERRLKQNAAAAAAIASGSSSSAAASSSLIPDSMPTARDIDPLAIYNFALAVHETGEKNGLSFIVQFLRGSKSSKVMERADRGRVRPLSACKSYGSLAGESQRFVAALGQWLLQVGVLENVYRAEFQIVQLASGGRRLVEQGKAASASGKSPVDLAGGLDGILPPELRQEVEQKRARERKKAGREKAAAQADAMAREFALNAASGASFDAHAALLRGGIQRSPEEELLLDTLIDCRAAIAKRRGIPPYSIFSRGELEAFARHRPTSLAALGNFQGVTVSKKDQFGAEIIACIVRVAKEQKMECDVMLPTPAPAMAMSSASPGLSASSGPADSFLSYTEFLSPLRRLPAGVHVDRTRPVEQSVPSSWHALPPSALTRVSLAAAAPIDLHATKLPKRVEAWTQLWTKPVRTFESVAASFGVVVSTLLGYCAQMISEGAAYEWARFNVPDAAVQQVQSEIVSCMALEAERSHGLVSPGFMPSNAGDGSVSLWRVPFLKVIKEHLPPTLDWGVLKIIVAHLQRLYGEAGPVARAPEAVAAPAASSGAAPSVRQRMGSVKVEKVDSDDSDVPLSTTASLNYLNRFKRVSPAKASPTPGAASSIAALQRPLSVPSSQTASASSALGLPRRCLSDILSQESSLSQPVSAAASAAHTAAAAAVHSVAASSSAVAAVLAAPFRGTSIAGSLARQPSVSVATSSSLHPLYTLPSSALDPSRLMTRPKIRVLELFVLDKKTVAQISSHLTLRTSTCVQHLADALVSGYELDLSSFNIDPSDAADVIRALTSTAPPLLPPLEATLKLNLASFIPAIVSVKKLVREEVSKESVLLLISQHIQKQVLAEQVESQRTAEVAAQAAAASSSAVVDLSASLDSDVIVMSDAPVHSSARESSLPPLELPQPLELRPALAEPLSVAPVPSGPGESHKRRAGAFLSSTSEAGSAEKRARITSAAADIDEDACAEVENRAAAFVESDCSQQSQSSSQQAQQQRRGSTAMGSKHVATPPSSMSLDDDDTNCKPPSAVVSDAAPTSASSELLPLSSASVLQLLRSAPLRLEQLCERMIPQGPGMWSALPKLQAVLAQLSEDGDIFLQKEQYCVL